MTPPKVPERLSSFVGVAFGTVVLFMLALIVVVLLSGCGPSEGQGYVVEKYIEPRSQTTMSIPMTVGNSTIIIPYVVIDDEDFVLWLDDEGDTFPIYVTSQEYFATDVGDFVTFERGALHDPPIKVRQ